MSSRQMHTLENRFLHSNGFCMGISGGGHDGLIRVMAANNKNKGLERMNESKPLVFIGIISQRYSHHAFSIVFLLILKRDRGTNFFSVPLMPDHT